MSEVTQLEGEKAWEAISGKTCESIKIGYFEQYVILEQI